MSALADLALHCLLLTSFLFFPSYGKRVSHYCLLAKCLHPGDGCGETQSTVDWEAGSSRKLRGSIL